MSAPPPSSPQRRCHRRQTLAALERSAVHQSLSTAASRVAMARARTATLDDPSRAMDVLRSLLQPAINAELRAAMADFVAKFFRPAADNARKNVAVFGNGADVVSSDKLVEEVCIRALEAAKTAFTDTSFLQNADPAQSPTACKRKLPNAPKGSPSAKKTRTAAMTPEALLSPSRANSDLILVSKTGRPVRREGPRWESERLTADTLFILGSRANKALGFAQTRGRLYMKHPDLFKYSGDQEDKEWLSRNHLMSTTGGKAYLMVLSDVLELARSPDYSGHPRQQPDELVGFTAPPFLLAKMRRFMSAVRTPRDVPDDRVVEHARRQAAEWEEERRRGSAAATAAPPPAMPQPHAFEAAPDGEQELLAEDQVKEEEEDDEELGFLNGVNLHSLVRELEAAEGGEEELLRGLAEVDDGEIAETTAANAL